MNRFILAAILVLASTGAQAKTTQQLIDEAEDAYKSCHANGTKCHLYTPLRGPTAREARLVL